MCVHNCLRACLHVRVCMHACVRVRGVRSVMGKAKGRFAEAGTRQHTAMHLLANLSSYGTTTATCCSAATTLPSEPARMHAHARRTDNTTQHNATPCTHAHRHAQPFGGPSAIGHRPSAIGHRLGTEVLDHGCCHLLTPSMDCRIRVKNRHACDGRVRIRCGNPAVCVGQ